MIDQAKIDEMLIQADELNNFLRELIREKNRGETDDRIRNPKK